MKNKYEIVSKKGNFFKNEPWKIHKEMVLDNIENKIENANKMNWWVGRHGDGCRKFINNNEDEIKNVNAINELMVRHGDGCRQVINNNEQ